MSCLCVADGGCAVAPRCTAGDLPRPFDDGGALPGTIDVHYELFHARDVPDAPSGTIVAVEGGPGGASTGSRDYYLDTFAPLLGDHQLLLVDLRGTGRSGAIACGGFQRLGTTAAAAIARCAARLGPRAGRYATAIAGDDLAAVLDHLGLGRVDLYGDSYGTFFVQSFVLRHPERVHRVVLDGTYGVEGLDPWYPEASEALRLALRRVCARDPGCAALGGDPVARTAALANALAAAPLAGRASDLRGRRRSITLDAPGLVALTQNATYDRQMYREFDPAVRAALDGDPTPLLRIAGEWRSVRSRPRDYSQALEAAVSCADYPQLYDLREAPDTRRRQFDAAVAALAAGAPDTFAPFDVATWVASPFNEYDLCLDWPDAPLTPPPAPIAAVYPDVPVLVLNGDLDTITPSAGARLVADRFPDARFVEVANAVHVTALADPRDCAGALAAEFLGTGAIADASCAAAAPPVRVLDAFWTAPAVVPAAPVPGLDAAAQRTVSAMLATAADVLNRRPVLYGTRGPGLRGGRYRFLGYDPALVELTHVALVPGVPVDGQLEWDEVGDHVRGTLTAAGITLALDDWRPERDAPCATVEVAGWRGCVPIP